MAVGCVGNECAVDATTVTADVVPHVQKVHRSITEILIGMQRYC